MERHTVRNNCRTLPTSAALSRTKSLLAGTPSAIWSGQDSDKRNELQQYPYAVLLLLACLLQMTSMTLHTMMYSRDLR